MNRSLYFLACAMTCCNMWAQDPEPEPEPEPKTLQQLVDETADEGTLTLEDDYVLTDHLSITKTMTIDLNGHNITNSASKAVVCNGGNLTIVDGTATEAPSVSGDYETVTYTSGKISSNTVAVDVKNSGTLTLQSGTIESTNAGPNSSVDSENQYGGYYAYAVRLRGGNCTLNVEGGYVKGWKYAVTNYGGSTVNVSGGVMWADKYGVIGGNGNETVPTTVNISGGTLLAHFKDQGDIAVGIYHPQVGSVTITGGTIHAKDGACVVMRAGNISMTGGTLISTGTASGLAGDARNTIPTAAIVVDVNANYPATKVDSENAKLNVSVTGGTITAEGKGVAVVNDGSCEDNVEAISVGGEVNLGESKLYSSKAFTLNDSDDAEYEYGGTHEYIAPSATYTRTVGTENHFGTMCVPFSLQSSGAIQYYTLGSISESTLALVETDEVEPNTPVIFWRSATSDENLSVNTSNAKVVKVNSLPEGTGELILVGTYAETVLTEGLSDIYYINGDKFHQALYSVTVPKHRAYIKYTAVSPAKPRVLSLFVDDADATAVEAAPANGPAVSAIYDASGRILTAPQKGLNIVKMNNGKTVKLLIK